MMQLKDHTLLKSACLLDGAWVPADDAKSADVHDPATGSKLGAVAMMGAAETARAIQAAADAFAKWRVQTADYRAGVLRAWFDLLMANQEDLSVIMSSEQGKPLAEA